MNFPPEDQCSLKGYMETVLRAIIRCRRIILGSTKSLLNLIYTRSRMCLLIKEDYFNIAKSLKHSESSAIRNPVMNGAVVAPRDPRKCKML